MPHHRPADAGQIAEEASGWYARLNAEDAGAGDRQRFDAWLAADERHRRAWEEIRSIAAATGMLAAPETASAGPRPFRASRPRAMAWAAAALVLLVLGLGSLWGQDLLASLRGDHVTGGERRRIVLADGSVMNLNVNSAVALSWTAAERRVELLRGEAFFTVTPDPARPFVVASREGRAEVLGTAFALRLMAGAARITVEEGSVAVSPPAGTAPPLRLGPGQAAVVREGVVGPAVAADFGADTQWRQGRIVFRQRPLAEVIEALDRYRPGAIVIADVTLGGQRVTGAFDIDDTDKALSAIETVMNLKIYRLTAYLTVVAPAR